LGEGDGLASSTSARGEVDCAVRPPYYVRVGAAASRNLAKALRRCVAEARDREKL
jgi:hypothetical protein